MSSPRDQGPITNRLGQLLVRDQKISLAQLREAQDLQAREGGRLGQQLVKLGFLQESELTDFLAKQFNVPSINLTDFEIDPEVIKLIPRNVAEKYTCIAVNRAGNSLIVAMADPSNIFAADDIKFITGYNVEVVVAAEGQIKESIEGYYGDIAKAEEVKAAAEGYEGLDTENIEVEGGDDEQSDAQAVAGLIDITRAEADQAPVVKLCNVIMLDAVKKGASDIHVELYEKSFRVRYRIDGELYEVMKPPMKLKNAIISRLKIMANLDIAERRLPQDGRMKLKLGKDREMDFRVNSLPCVHGEKICIRLLDKSNLQLDMTKLGFDPVPLQQFKDSIHRPWGMVLVTGPTGSGKTTTLYSALSELNTTDVNISTAEDPVEFQLAGINQVNVVEDIGLSFAAALRAFLRQDPDIIMVGEIRDFETAEIAIKAALTGHVVLSTLHTNDAPATVSRLLNMGIEPFLVVAAVVCILAQRLSRKNCADCNAPDPEVTKQAIIDAGFSPDEAAGIQAMRGTGCKTCNNLGKKGRVALYEVMLMYDELKDFVLNGASSMELKREAIRLGMQTLRMSAQRKFREGRLTLDEVLYNTAPD